MRCWCFGPRAAARLRLCVNMCHFTLGSHEVTVSKTETMSTSESVCVCVCIQTGARVFLPHRVKKFPLAIWSVIFLDDNPLHKFHPTVHWPRPRPSTSPSLLKVESSSVLLVYLSSIHTLINFSTSCEVFFLSLFFIFNPCKLKSGGWKHGETRQKPGDSLVIIGRGRVRLQQVNSGMLTVVTSKFGWLLEQLKD